jgi:PLD-like domain
VHLLMNRIFSNGPAKDFVINPLRSMAAQSTLLCIAAPYVTMTEDLVDAANAGRSVRLIVGLNPSTNPKALQALHACPNAAIRYFTRRFHAKIYLFDKCALVGSSNLTNAGMTSNREATISVDDTESLGEISSLFNELWESAQVLTSEKLKNFSSIYPTIKPTWPEADPRVESAVGVSQPVNIAVASRKHSAESIFLEQLRREVYQEYGPAFSEVTSVLQANSLRRTELEELGVAAQTNRFLNWVRLTYAPGDESWQQAPLRNFEDRRAEISGLGEEWANTDKPKIPEDFADWLREVSNTFGTSDAIESASKEKLSEGLSCIHAFNEQLRFVKGGRANLTNEFWNANDNDVDRVRRTLLYFVHGKGDFIQRLHDILYDPAWKLRYVGMFCALELYGSVKQEECPPINGRIAKALRYLGFEVRGE